MGATPQSSTPNNGEIIAKGWGMPTGNVKGYNLYMSETSGTGFKKMNDTVITGSSYLVPGLEINRRYFFMLTSVTNDSPPVESRPSPEWSMLSHPAPDSGAAPANAAPANPAPAK
jgi:hypothetical protein